MRGKRRDKLLFWGVCGEALTYILGYTVVSTDAVGQMPLSPEKNDAISFGEGAGIHLTLLGGGGKGMSSCFLACFGLEKSMSRTRAGLCYFIKCRKERTQLYGYIYYDDVFVTKYHILEYYRHTYLGGKHLIPLTKVGGR